MLSNEDRRLALAEARENAIRKARAADRFPMVDMSGATTMEQRIARREHIMREASMWAVVAEAMKAGPAMEADAVPEAGQVSDGYVWHDGPANEIRIL